MGVGQEVRNLDPCGATEVPEKVVLGALFEGLVRFHPRTLAAIPGVAERWEVSDGGRKYRFFLRKDARWSNGDPLTAEHFVSAFERALSPSSLSSQAPLLYGIKNAESFHRGVTKDFGAVGVRAINPLCLEIQLQRPCSTLLSILMQPIAYPIHPKALSENNAQNDHCWTSPECYISNGPFRLATWQTGYSVTVAKNPFYWNEKNVPLNAVEFFSFSDPHTEERAFRNQQLHITENVPYQKLMVYAKTPCLKLAPFWGIFSYVLNTRCKPLDDARVRRALSMAINRELLAGNATVKKHVPAYTLVMSDSVSKNGVKENILAAQHLLSDAGYPNGKNFPKLQLIFNDTEGQHYLAEAIQEMWDRNLHISVEIISLEWKAFLHRRQTHNFAIARGGWIAEFPDPQTFLSPWLSSSPNNFAQWHSSTFDALFSQITTLPHGPQRLAKLYKAEAILTQCVPAIPIHANLSSHLVHESVQNWHSNVLDWHDVSVLNLKP